MSVVLTNHICLFSSHSEFLQSLQENSFSDTHLSPTFTLPPLPVSSHRSSLQLSPSVLPVDSAATPLSHSTGLSNLNNGNASILRQHDDRGILEGSSSHAKISAALDPGRAQEGSTSRDSNGLGNAPFPLDKYVQLPFNLMIYSGARSSHEYLPIITPLFRTERFLLTAADQKDGTRSDRLARVIHAKFEAGLLRPYNHVAGYTRLMRWMADK